MKQIISTDWNVEKVSERTAKLEMKCVLKSGSNGRERASVVPPI